MEEEKPGQGGGRELRQRQQAAKMQERRAEAQLQVARGSDDEGAAGQEER